MDPRFTLEWLTIQVYADRHEKQSGWVERHSVDCFHYSVSPAHWHSNVPDLQPQPHAEGQGPSPLMHSIIPITSNTFPRSARLPLAPSESLLR